MVDDKRTQRLQNRFNRPRSQPQEPGSRGPVSTRRSKKIRKRQSLHFADSSYEKLDQAYKKAAHAVYPNQLEKAPFIEALIEYGISHLEEVTEIAQEIQDED